MKIYVNIVEIKYLKVEEVSVDKDICINLKTSSSLKIKNMLFKEYKTKVNISSYKDCLNQLKSNQLNLICLEKDFVWCIPEIHHPLIEVCVFFQDFDKKNYWLFEIEYNGEKYFLMESEYFIKMITDIRLLRY